MDTSPRSEWRVTRLALELRESFSIAAGALRANTARGGLATLGIVIGIVAVVTTMTAANGLQNRFRDSFSAVGADVIYVSRMPWVVMNDFFLYRNRPPLDLREARALEERMHGRAIVNPTVDGRRDVKFHAETMDGVPILGTTEKHMALSSARPEIGRFLLPFDVRFKKNVCVIGADVRDLLFGSANPINQTISIGRTAFRVIGVMEKQGGSFLGGPNFDRQVFVPITSYVKAFGGAHHQDVSVAVKAPAAVAIADFEYEVIGEMRKIRRLRPAETDNFSLNKLDTLVGTFNRTIGVVLLVGLLITSISLFVGAVGVMNIMLVSVNERTREIGIRRAVGATRRSILLQFLVESSAIGAIGGAIGLLLAAIVTAVIDRMLMPASISIPILGIAVLVSIAVGVLAGIVPAYRGAHVDPVEALRYE